MKMILTVACLVMSLLCTAACGNANINKSNSQTISGNSYIGRITGGLNILQDFKGDSATIRLELTEQRGQDVQSYITSACDIGDEKAEIIAKVKKLLTGIKGP